MMLTQPTSGWGQPDCKLIDFGLTHSIDNQSRDFVGTPSYMAPEIVMGTVAYTIKADMWSVGVTACELLASKPPFGRPQDHRGQIEPVLQRIRSYRRFDEIESALSRCECWASRSNSAKDFIESLIIADPADRPHSDQALEHSWLTRSKALPTSVAGYMLKSMIKFIGASPLIRRCLLIIAARIGSPKMDQIGGVFLSIDTEHHGTISREGLAGAVSAVATCWEPEFDVDDFFDAADQDHKDVIGFLEFAAACIWDAEDPTSVIAERAFHALDDNHDGMVHLDDCRHLFRQCDMMELQRLPMNRAFTMNEWCLAIVGSVDQQPRKRADKQEGSMLTRFVRSIICSHDDPWADDNDEYVCR
jgi:Ca2+-binding EF-hand superfamily protein